MNNYIMNEKTTEFGKLCRVYRSRLGLSIKDVVPKVGYKQSTITKIENGEMAASFDFIKKSIDIYKIIKKEEQFEFLLSYLKCGKKFEIPLNQLGTIRKEWLTALCILGDVKEGNPEGWNELLQWVDEFVKKLHEKKPKHTILGVDGPL
jgi:transcriptional regulator with XRE-family HTH domain